MRVLGQQRTVQISADHILVEDAFVGVLSVVTVAVHYFAKRRMVPDVRPAAVVLKADDLIGQLFRERLISENDVGD